MLAIESGGVGNGLCLTWVVRSVTLTSKREAAESYVIAEVERS